MNLYAIFLANGVGIFILLMMYYTSLRKILRSHTEDRIFRIMMLGVMLGCIAEALSYALDGHVFPGARGLCYVINTYLYTANFLLPLLLLIYVDLGFGGTAARIRQNYRPQFAIAIVMLLINAVNFFVPISFEITDQNVYLRRPFAYVYFFVLLYYCFSSIIWTRRYEKENGAKAFVNISMFLIPTLIGGGLQFVFYGVSVGWLAAAIGLAGIYIMRLNEMAYIDPLLGIYNRQYLNHLLTIWVRKGYHFAGAMVDLDRFKHINDSFGHDEGDRALQTIAAILRQSRSDNELIFRFAGDEFVILKMTRDESQLEAFLQRVCAALDERNRSDVPYPLQISYGTGSFPPPHSDGAKAGWAGIAGAAVVTEATDGPTTGVVGNAAAAGTAAIDAFMKEMDDRMYEMKERHHGEG